jgi:large subunit ribosomal protein L17
MNQADVTKLMSRLRIKYSPVKRRLKNIEGPEGRLKKIRKTLTALIKYERIELNYNRADETRGYVERVSTCPVTLIVPMLP